MQSIQKESHRLSMGSDTAIDTVQGVLVVCCNRIRQNAIIHDILIILTRCGELVYTYQITIIVLINYSNMYGGDLHELNEKM